MSDAPGKSPDAREKAPDASKSGRNPIDPGLPSEVTEAETLEELAGGPSSAAKVNPSEDIMHPGGVIESGDPNAIREMGGERQPDGSVTYPDGSVGPSHKDRHDASSPNKGPEMPERPRPETDWDALNEVEERPGPSRPREIAGEKSPAKKDDEKATWDSTNPPSDGQIEDIRNAPAPGTSQAETLEELAGEAPSPREPGWTPRGTSEGAESVDEAAARRAKDDASRAPFEAPPIAEQTPQELTQAQIASAPAETVVPPSPPPAEPTTVPETQAVPADRRIETISRRDVLSAFNSAFEYFESIPESELTPQQLAAREQIRAVKEKTLDKGKLTYTNSFKDSEGGIHRQKEGVPVDDLIDFLTTQIDKGDLLETQRNDLIEQRRILALSNISYLRFGRRREPLAWQGRVSQEFERIKNDPRLTTGDEKLDYEQAAHNIMKKRELVVPRDKRFVESEDVPWTTPVDAALSASEPTVQGQDYAPNTPPEGPEELIQPPSGETKSPEPVSEQEERGQAYPRYENTGKGVKIEDFEALFPEQIAVARDIVENAKEHVTRSEGEKDDAYERRVLEEVRKRLAEPGVYKDADDPLYLSIVGRENLSQPHYVLMAAEFLQAQKTVRTNQARVDASIAGMERQFRRDVKTEVVHVGEPSFIEGDYEHVFNEARAWKDLPQTDIYAFTIVADRLLDTVDPSLQGANETKTYRELMRELSETARTGATKAEKDQAAQRLVSVRSQFYSLSIESIRTLDQGGNVNPNPETQSPKGKVLSEMHDALRSVQNTSLESLLDQYQGVSQKDEGFKNREQAIRLLGTQKPYLLDFALKGADLMWRRISYNAQLETVPELIYYKKFVQGTQAETVMVAAAGVKPEQKEVVEGEQGAEEKPPEPEETTEKEGEPKPEEEPKPPSLEEIRREFWFVNRSSDIRKAAREIAEEQLRLRMKTAGRWERIGLRLMEEYHRQQYIRWATDALLRTNNSYAELDIVGQAAKETANLAKEGESGRAKIEALRAGLNVEGERVITVKGDLRKEILEKIIKPAVRGEIKTQAQVQNVLREFVRSHPNDAQVQEVFGRGATEFNEVADYFATDLLEVAQNLSAHNVALESLDQMAEIKIANAAWAAHSGTEVNIVDRAVIAAQSGRIRSRIFNPATLGAISSVASFMALRPLFGTGAAHVIAPGAGFIAGGGFAALRRARDLKVDRLTHQRELTYNATIEGRAPRREAMERYRYDVVSDKELLDGRRGPDYSGDSRGLRELMKLDLSGTEQTDAEGVVRNREALFRRMAEIQARIDFSTINRVDLVRYSSKVDVEQGRLELLKNYLEAWHALNNAGMEAATINDNLTQSSRKWTDILTTNREQQDKSFNWYRVRQALRAGAQGGAVGLAAGIVGREAIGLAASAAGIDIGPTIADAVSNLTKGAPSVPGVGGSADFGGGTGIENLGGGGGNLEDRILESGYKLDFSENGQSVSIISPNGDQVLSNLPVEDGKIIGTGELTDEAKRALGQTGLVFTENPLIPGGTEEVRVLGPGGEWERLQTEIRGRDWYGYDTGRNIGNELELHTKFKDGKFILSMAGMGEAHAKGLGSIDVQDLLHDPNKKLGFALTLPGHGREIIWLPADEHGRFVFDPDSTRVIEMPNGEKTTVGELYKMFVDPEADGKTGHLRLGLNGERGRLEAAMLVDRPKGEVLHVFATSRGTGEVLDTITRETPGKPGGFEIDIPTQPEPPAPPPTPPGEPFEIPVIPTPFAPRKPLEELKKAEPLPVKGTQAPTTPEQGSVPEHPQGSVQRMLASLEAEVPRDHEYFVENPPEEIRLTPEQMKELELIEPFFIHFTKDGQLWIKTNERVVPYVWNPKVGIGPEPGQGNERFEKAEGLTNGDSGLLALAAVSSETPEKQTQLYRALAHSIVEMHKNNPELLRIWLVKQGEEKTQSGDIQTPDSIDVFVTNDLESGTQKPRPEHERLVIFDTENFPNIDPARNEALREQAWTQRLDELRDVITLGTIEQTHLRWIEFLSHSVDVAKLVQIAKEQQPAPPPPTEPEEETPVPEEELPAELPTAPPAPTAPTPPSSATAKDVRAGFQGLTEGMIQAISRDNWERVHRRQSPGAGSGTLTDSFYEASQRLFDAGKIQSEEDLAALYKEVSDVWRAKGDWKAALDSAEQRIAGASAPPPTPSPTPEVLRTTAPTPPEPEAPPPSPERPRDRDLLKDLNRTLVETTGPTANYEVTSQQLIDYLKTLKFPFGASIKGEPQVAFAENQVTVSAAIGVFMGGASFTATLINDPTLGVRLASPPIIYTSGTANMKRGDIESKIGNLNQLLTEQINTHIDPAWEVDRFYIGQNTLGVNFRKKA